MSYTVLAISTTRGLIFARGDIETSDEAQDTFVGLAEDLCGIANPNAFNFGEEMSDKFLINNIDAGDVGDAYVAAFPSKVKMSGEEIALHLLHF